MCSHQSLISFSHSNANELPFVATIIDSIIDSERKAFLVDYIKALPEKKRIIVSLYYYEEITFKEIGQVLNITESRVCQIHSQVIKDLRITLQQREQ